MNCELKLPAEILFGAGERHKLARKLPPGNVLIAAGRHARKRIEEELLPQLEGRMVSFLADITPELPLADVERLLAEGRKIEARSVIGWGGGSAIDAAKTAAALMNLEGSVADYFYGRRKIASRSVFFAALPTTAGTGAEITPNAVLCDPETLVKQSIRHNSMFADLAIVDPELTYDCPPAVTAASGFDAFTQAVESYLSKNATPVTEALALDAAKYVLHPLASVVKHCDEIGREEIARGSMLGAMAFTQSGLGAVHGIGHPLGSLLHVPHGVCCAVLLPTILRWNLATDDGHMELLARELLQNTPEIMIRSIEGYRKMCGLPSDFKKYGLAEKHFDFIVKNCRSGSMRSNPRELSDDDVRSILREVM